MANEYADASLRSRRKPSTRALIVVGVAIQAFFIVLGGLYLLRPPRQPEQPLLVWQVLTPEDMVYRDTDVAPQKGKQLPPVDAAEITLGTPTQVKDGERLFGEYCISCHGEHGMGNGPSGVTLNPRPRDLTSLVGWKRGTKLTDIFRTVTLGLEGTQMSGFDYLSVEERFALAHFAMGFASGHPGATRADLDSLDRQFGLSQGMKEPNTIPLGVAMEKLAGEAAQVPAEPDSAKLAVSASRSPRGAHLFGEVVRRSDYVGYALTSDSSWVGRPERLRSLATGGAPTNGFSARVELLSSDDWRSLHEYLMVRYRAR